MFSRSEVIVRSNKHTDRLTNKQTPLKTSTSLRYATPVGNNHTQALSTATAGEYGNHYNKQILCTAVLSDP